jgi:hypothetical protein
VKDLDGFDEVFAAQPLPKVVFAKFRSADDASKFIRTQKQIRGFADAKLWASKSKSPEERRRGRALGKIKRMLIEVGGFAAGDVILDWRNSSAHVVKGDDAPKVAEVKASGVIEWATDSGVDLTATKAAVEAEMEDK